MKRLAWLFVDVASYTGICALVWHHPHYFAILGLLLVNGVANHAQGFIGGAK